jgi:tRNA1Val (adenine37-N6)-methyltransferase
MISVFSDLDFLIAFRMANEWFRFKQFLVRQESTAMKVGTDGVLLGAWADLNDGGRQTADGGKKSTDGGRRTVAQGFMLDVGTGTGLLALMLAQRFPAVLIDAVEIEPSSCRQARLNVELSPWPDRINVIGVDFLEWEPEQLYDLIVCNPPFFSNSLRAAGMARSLARHDDLLPMDRLIDKSARLLNPDGSLALVIPAGRLDESVTLAAGSGLFITKVLRIRGTPRSAVKRILIRFGRRQVPAESDELVIRQEVGGPFSDTYLRLTEPFYL